jgi:hypothetical protein
MKLKKICEFCNKEFEVVLSRSRVASGNRGRFCNIGCYHAWQKKRASEKTEKKCTLCHKVKPISSFYSDKAAYDRLCSSCKECTKSAAREYYWQNKEEMHEVWNRRKLELVTEYRKQWREIVKDRFGLRCPDYGIEGPYCIFDFHHLDPEEKEFQLSYMVSYRPTEKRIKELDKGILVCSNCHRIRHWRVLNGGRS